jgi:hypothetical protein
MQWADPLLPPARLGEMRHAFRKGMQVLCQRPISEAKSSTPQ